MTAPARTRRTAAPLGRLVRSELDLALGRPRTAVVLAVTAIVPLLGAIQLRSHGSEEMTHVLGVLTVGFSELAAFSLGMPVVLVAADAFATERARGTLDALRLSPVSTGRLLLLKSCAVTAAAVAAALVTSVVALLAGSLLVGFGPYGGGGTLSRSLAITAWNAGQLTGLGMLLLALSAAVRRPVVVVAVGLAGLTVAPLVGVLWEPAAAVLPTGHWHEVLAGLVGVPAATGEAWATTLRAAGFAVAGAGIAVFLLSRRER